MANANQKNVATTTTTEEAPVNAAAALINARAAMQAIGMSDEAISKALGAQMAPIMEAARTSILEAVTEETRTLVDVLIKHEHRALLDGDTFAVIIRFNGDEVNVARHYVAPKKKGTKNGTGTKSSSISAGNVLIVNEAAFKDFATLNRKLGIFDPKSSAVRDYTAKTKEDAVTYPEPQLVPYETFYGDNAAKLAPAGYYETNKKTGRAVKVEAVR